MTFDDLIEEVFLMIGEDRDAPQYWSEAEIKRRINRAYRAIVTATEILEEIHLLHVVNGTSVYSLPARAGRINRVAYDIERLPAVSVDDLRWEDEDWQDRDGLIDRYHVDQLDEGKFEVWKTPEDDGKGVEMVADDTGVSANWSIIGSYRVGDRVRMAAGSDRIFLCRVDHDASVDNWPGLALLEQWRDYWVEQADAGILAALADSGGDYTFTWAADTTNNANHTDEEVGIGAGFDATGGSPPFRFKDNHGLVLSLHMLEDNLEVWTERIPEDMIHADDEPEFSDMYHLAVAFAAAGAALRKESEAANHKLAMVYEGLADDYVAEMVETVREPTPEEVHVMGGEEAPQRHQFVRMPGNYPGYRW